MNNYLGEFPETTFITAAICTRNRGDRVIKAIQSILAVTYPCFEVILIDQSTNQETQNAITQFLPDSRFKYIPTETVGVARARNLALEKAAGTIVAFTDDDCAVETNWLEVINQVFFQNPSVAVLFCNVVPVPYDRTSGFIPAYTRKNEKLVKNFFDKCVARGIGAGMAVRKKAVQDIGGFDNNLGPGSKFMDCEDGDIAVRVLLFGWHVFETHRTSVHHDGYRTWKEGKELTKRNWIGIGAAYAKPLRCGHWQFTIVVLYEAFVIALLKPLSALVLLKSPRGLRSFYYFCKGFSRGLQAPMDKGKVIFDTNPTKRVS